MTMKREILKRLLLFLLATLMLFDSALAGGFDAKDLYRDPETAIKYILKKNDDWVIVTKENLSEHEETVTACGDTMENVRFRFEHGDILLEAYNPGLPNGRVRLQAFNNEFTRSVWHLDDLTKKEYIAVAKELEENLFDGYLHLFNIKYYTERANLRDFKGSLIAYPPYPYESGLFRLEFFNGKAYLLTYTQPTQASAKKLLGDNHTYARLQDWTMLSGKGVLQDTVERQTALTDLRTDTGRLILNAHSGAFTMTGKSEKKAEVTLQNGESTWEASVDADGNYKAKITLVPGENEVVATARKQGLRENTLTRVIPVDDGIAALEMTEYPYDLVERDKLDLAGKAAPGAEVTVQVDDKEPQTMELDEDGTFKTKLTADDWVLHTVTVTAHEDGLEDCTARFSFTPIYDEAAKGITAYKKTLTEGMTTKKLSADPAAYIGSRIKMEVYTTGVERVNGQLVLHGNIESDKKRPVILVVDDYLEDQILDKMKLLVYGEVIEPSLTEPPIPRVEVEYISYLKTVYKPRRY